MQAQSVSEDSADYDTSESDAGTAPSTGRESEASSSSAVSEGAWESGDEDAGGFRIESQEVTAHDIRSLRPREYVNDKVINAYLALLRARLQAGGRHVFIASTFLFTKLCDGDLPAADPDAPPALAPIRTACAKWYKRQPVLLAHKWVVIPVNYNHHWSFIAVLNPAAYLAAHTPPPLLPAGVAPPPPQEAKHTVIASFDSMAYSHRGAQRTIAAYLAHRWMVEIGHPEAVDAGNALARRMEEDLPIQPAALPSQRNGYDCGCFMLHYLDLLTMPGVAAVIELHPTYWLSAGLRRWFPRKEAEAKRRYLRALFACLRERQAGGGDAAAVAWFAGAAGGDAPLQGGVARAVGKLTAQCAFAEDVHRWEQEAVALGEDGASSTASAFDGTEEEEEEGEDDRSEQLAPTSTSECDASMRQARPATRKRKALSDIEPDAIQATQQARKKRRVVRRVVLVRKKVRRPPSDLPADAPSEPATSPAGAAPPQGKLVKKKAGGAARRRGGAKE